MTENEFRLLKSLAWMCQQYLTSPDWVGLDHMCMSAGEEAVDILSEYGLVDTDHRGGDWTEAGQALLMSHDKDTVDSIKALMQSVKAKP